MVIFVLRNSHLWQNYLFKFICLRNSDPYETFSLSVESYLSFLGPSAPLWYFLELDILLGK